MIRRFLNAESGTITAGAVILVLSGVGSRLLGLVRDRILAGMFGAGDVLDAYYAAFRVPDLLYAILVLGALSSALIPVFIAQRRRNVAAGWRFINNVLGVGLVVMALLAALLMVVAPTIIDLVAPGFAGETQSLAILLTRIMLLSPLLLGVSSVLGGVLQSLHRFVSYALAPVLYNVGIIVGVLGFVPLVGPVGLAWGVVLGAGLHLLIQVPALRDTGFRLRLIITPLVDGMREVGRLMVPRTIGVAAHQVNLVVVTAIASLLTAGSITIFNFANNIHYVAVGAVGIPFALAAFPRLAEAFTDSAPMRFRQLLVETLREVLYMVVPIAVLMVVLRAHIVRVVLGTGAFGWEATRLTAAALALFAVSMVAQAMIPLFARAFYARHNTRTPVVVSVIAMALNAGLAFLFVRGLADGVAATVRPWLRLEGVEHIGVLGLPIAFSVAGLVHLVVLMVLLSREDRLLDTIAVGRGVLKTAVAGVGCGIAAWLVLRAAAPVTSMATFWGVLLQGVIAGGAGLGVYWLVTRLLGMPESSLRRLWRRMRA